jgi:methylmalonyl-CoA/ethylmalonyl-CoA epimerase
MDRILFDHIAIGMLRMAEAPAVLVGALGGVPDAGRAAGGVFRWGTWAFAGGGSIEIIEPLGDDGFLHRFLATRGPGIHHVTFKVPSLDEVCDRARARGYGIVGYDASDPDWKEAFLHPKEALGIVVQLAEARPAEAAGPGGRQRWKAPPGPPAPPPPVTIVGLRMRAASRARAQAQWGAILQGECRDGPAGELICRWPPSPMRIAVDVDLGAEEGPVAIEYAADRPVSLPPGASPVLGTALVRVPVPPIDTPVDRLLS